MANMAVSLLLIFLIVPLVTTQRSSDMSLMADRGFGGQGGGEGVQGFMGGGGGGVRGGFFDRDFASRGFGPSMRDISSSGRFGPTGPSVPMDTPWGRTGFFNRPVRAPYPFSRMPRSMGIIEPLRGLLNGIMPGGRMGSFGFRDSDFRGRSGFSDRRPGDPMGFSSRMGQMDVPTSDGVLMGRMDAPMSDSRRMGRMDAPMSDSRRNGRMDVPRGDGIHIGRMDAQMSSGSRMGRMNSPFGNGSRMRKMRSSPETWRSPFGFDFFGEGMGDMGKMSGPLGFSSDMGMDPFGFDMTPSDTGMHPGRTDPRVDPPPDGVTSGAGGSEVSSMTETSTDGVQNVVGIGISSEDSTVASTGNGSPASTSMEDVGETGAINETKHESAGQSTSAGTKVPASVDKSVSSGPVSGTGAESSSASVHSSISRGPNAGTGAESSGVIVDSSVSKDPNTGTVAELSGVIVDSSVSRDSNAGTRAELSGVIVDSSVSRDPHAGTGARSSGVSVGTSGGAGAAVDTRDPQISQLMGGSIIDPPSSGNISGSIVSIDTAGSVEGQGSGPSGVMVETQVDSVSTDRGRDARRQDVVPDRGRSGPAVGRMRQSSVFEDRRDFGRRGIDPRGMDRRMDFMGPSSRPRQRSRLTSLIDLIRRLIRPARTPRRFPSRGAPPMSPRRPFFTRSPSFGSFSPRGMFGSPFGAPFRPRFF